MSINASFLLCIYACSCFEGDGGTMVHLLVDDESRRRMTDFQPLGFSIYLGSLQLRPGGNCLLGN